MTKPQPSKTDSEAHEDVRVGYNAAVLLTIYDGQLSWQVAGTFVQVAILMIAGAYSPVFIDSGDGIAVHFGALLVSLGGLTMTCLFGSTVARIRTYERYWVLRAAQLESLLNERVDTVRGSNHLSESGAIKVDGATVEIGRIAAVKSRTLLGALFLGFSLTFLFAGVMNAWHLFHTVRKPDALIQAVASPQVPTFSGNIQHIVFSLYDRPATNSTEQTQQARTSEVSVASKTSDAVPTDTNAAISKAKPMASDPAARPSDSIPARQK